MECPLFDGTRIIEKNQMIDVELIIFDLKRQKYVPSFICLSVRSKCTCTPQRRLTTKQDNSKAGFPGPSKLDALLNAYIKIKNISNFPDLFYTFFIGGYFKTCHTGGTPNVFHKFVLNAVIFSANLQRSGCVSRRDR